MSRYWPLPTLAWALVAAGVLASVSARADSLGPYIIDLPSAQTDWTRTIQVPRFNPAQGTLTSVEIGITGILSQVVVELSNSYSSYPSYGSVTVDCHFRLSDPATGFQPAGLDLFSSSGYGLAPYDEEWFYLPGNGDNESTVYDCTLDPSLARYVNGFVGTGNMSLTASAFCDAGAGADQGYAPSVDEQSIFAQGTAFITYGYTALPEPGTLALLGLGALGVLRRRRRA